MRERTSEERMAMCMTWKAALAATALLIVETASASADQIFPIVPFGENFSGQITIDPAGASATSACCGGIIYTSTGSMGTISVTIAGVTFSGPLSDITAFPGVGEPPSHAYSLFASSDTSGLMMDGIPFSGEIGFLLFGTTGSTSIFPLDLGAYTSSVFDCGVIGTEWL
jgi:hypothetical protein